MMASSSSLKHPLGEVFASEPGQLRLSSRSPEWANLHLAEYDQPIDTEEFWTVPTEFQLVVLMIAGSCKLESGVAGRWRSVRYDAGTLGFTQPGNSALLRWRGARNKRTLHTYVPATIMRSAAEQIPSNRRRADRLDALVDRDGPITSLLLAIRAGALSNAPELYAESAAHLLAMHMLLGRDSAGSHGFAMDDARLARAEGLLREAISGTVTLSELADAAGWSRFDLLRAANAKWGETPMRRLTRWRMERACELLASGSASITSIALDCGYGSSAHFATAFRRHLGVSPTRYREDHR